MRIVIDMDGTVVDLLGKWLRVYNEEWKDALTVGDLTTWDIHKHVKKDCGQAIYDIAKRKYFFDDLEPLPGAIEGVRALEADGHEIALITSTLCADSARAKIDWAQEHLGFGRRKVILMHPKHWVDADLLIDDSPSNVRDWCAKGAPAATIAYPYNACVRDRVYCYADGYADTAQAWAELVRAVRTLE